jgi:hypothetical protein
MKEQINKIPGTSLTFKVSFSKSPITILYISYNKVTGSCINNSKLLINYCSNVLLYIQFIKKYSNTVGGFIGLPS